MSKDDLQPTPEELAKLAALQTEVDVDFARRAKLKRILEAKRKLDAKRKLEAAEATRAEAKLALMKRESAAAAEAARTEALATSRTEALATSRTEALDEFEELEDLSEEPRNKPSIFRRLFGRVSAGDAIELASEARQELEAPKEKGKKSLLWSGGLSVVAGPAGWLYAGSLREAIPAGAGYLAVAALATKIIPGFLLWPVAGVLLPISGIAGVVYAWQYNRKGKRVRLFGDSNKKRKQLEK